MGTIDGDLAVLVRTWRERALLSQEQLAARAGLGVRTVRRLESASTRRPRGDSLRLLADALGLNESERALLVAAARVDPFETSLAPQQLPAQIQHFVGRDKAQKLLTGLLGEGGNPGGMSVVVAIGGTAGIGKTALALRWAHAVAHRFPDGQLYVDLRGYSSGAHPIDPATAVRGFLDALSVAPQRIPSSPDAQFALYRSLLARRRMLIVLDNARDSSQVRALLPGSPGSAVVVTSRSRLVGLGMAGAYYVNIGLLSSLESRELLLRRLGPEHGASDPMALEKVVACCAGLPLALAVVSARAAGNPLVTLGALAAELGDPRYRLDALSGDDPNADVRAVFSWSYHCLDAGAARLFRLLGLHPGPDIGTAAVASLLGVAQREVRAPLRELEQANLIAEHVSGRYKVHDLLHTYAAECVRREEDEAQVATAVGRMLDHYVHTGCVAAHELSPQRDRLTLGPARPGTSPERIEGRASALAWFAAEHHVLVAAVAVASEVGLQRHVWQIAWTMADYLDRTGHWQDRITTGFAALAAANADVVPGLLAKAHHNLAHTYLSVGNLDAADGHLCAALGIVTEDGDVLRAANTHMYLADLRMRQSRWTEAVELAQMSIRLADACGARRVQASALNHLARALIPQGEHEMAVASCRRALEINVDIEYLDGQASCWDTLGQLHSRRDEGAAAITCYRRALTLYRRVGDSFRVARTLDGMGDAFLSAGQALAAARSWRRALAILGELNHPEAERITTKLVKWQAPPRR